MVLSMFFAVGFGQSLRDINLTLGLLVSKVHVILRDSVGVGGSIVG